MPEIWTEDHARCQRCHVPEGITFASKPDLAVQLLDCAVTWGVPFATVVTDAGYGIPSFLRALDKRGLRYVCAIASDFGVRLLDEMREAASPPSSDPCPQAGPTQEAASSPTPRCPGDHRCPT